MLWVSLLQVLQLQARHVERAAHPTQDTHTAAWRGRDGGSDNNSRVAAKLETFHCFFASFSPQCTAVLSIDVIVMGRPPALRADSAAQQIFLQARPVTCLLDSN